MKTGMETVYIETGIAGLSLVEMKFIYPSENSTGIESNFLCAAAGDRDRGIRRVGLALIAKVPAPPQNYPWCAQYAGAGGGATNCGFVSYAQCMQTLQGMGGFCVQNTQYLP